jgi:flagellar biosynthesis/type III secretory pathway M-ring protein FliF/YscJ
LIVETLPFETTLLTEPPQASVPAGAPAAKTGQPFGMGRNMLMIGGGAAAVVFLILVAALMRRRTQPALEATAPAALPAAQGAGPAQISQPVSNLEQQLEAKLAKREAQQQELDAQALSALKLAPAITKTSEVLAKHLREKVKEDPGLSAHVLQSWIREDGHY